MIWATVITDASFCHKTKAAGWAAWIRIDGRKEPIKQYSSFSKKPQNSQEAEIKAAINGAFLAKKNGADAVLIQSDCMAVVDLVNRKTKKPAVIMRWRNWLADAGIADLPMFAKHVKGHTTVKDARSFVNRWCDAKANEARLGMVH